MAGKWTLESELLPTYLLRCQLSLALACLWTGVGTCEMSIEEHARFSIFSTLFLPETLLLVLHYLG
jgi:hypothetical protein